MLIPSSLLKKNLSIDTDLIYQLIDKWTELHKIQSREILLFNSISRESVSNHFSNGNEIFFVKVRRQMDIFRGVLLTGLIYVFIFILSLLSKLAYIASNGRACFVPGNHPLIVGLSISRIPVPSSTSIDQAIHNLISSNLNQYNYDLLFTLLQDFPPVYLSANTSYASVTSKHLPKRRTLEGLRLFSLLTYLACICCSFNQLDILRRSANTPQKLIEHLLLIGSYIFIRKCNARNILLLTSNTRSIDFFLVSSTYTKTKCLEIMHGVPTRYIYERMQLLNPHRTTSFRSIRMLPVTSKTCFFSGLPGTEYINLNMDLIELNENVQIINAGSCLTKLLFIGGTCHDENFMDSDFHKYEIKIIQCLHELCSQHLAHFEIIYIPHPANKSRTFADLKNYSKVSINGFYHEVTTSHFCISVLSSALWEAQFLGKKTCLCAPKSDQLFSKTDLQLIDTVYSPLVSLSDQLSEFLCLRDSH